MVKFTRDAFLNSKLNIGLQKGASYPLTTTGLSSIDVLLNETKVTSIENPYIEPQNRALAEELGTNRWFMLHFDPAEDVIAAAERFAADANVEYATPDWRAFPMAVPSDPLYPDSWGHNNTAQLPDLDWGGTYDHTLPNTVGTPGFDANAQGAWDNSQGYGSSNIIVAIIDTGVDIDHPDLTLVSGYDFGDNDSNPNDDSAARGHGTCCAGVATANVNNGLGACGSAPNSRVMPLKVANSAGSMYFSAIVNAIYYAADNGADVISISLGAAGVSSDPATDAALSYAYSAGCIICAATGNENASTIHYPAINTYVIGVGAASPCGDRKRSSSLSYECNPGVNTDPNGYTCDGERWWGSNYGPNTPDAAGAVDILGPTILPTTDIAGSDGYRSGDYEPFFNGTSCATPYVAGVCALIKAQNPTWTPAQVRNQLVTTAIDIVNVESGSGWDRYSGYGMVDAQAATGGGTPPPPTAAFTGSPTSGDAPLTVNFTDQSSGSPTSWSWDFGDGIGTSTQQNPSYTYDNAGTYTVTLTASNSYGSDDEVKVDYIMVTSPSPPTADFAGSPTSGVYPLDVTFSDLSTGDPTAWSWDFGDGGTSPLQNPVHTYTTAGTYTVTLTATNAYGFDDEVKTDYIDVREPGVSTFVTADGESSIYGTVSGSYTDTHISDDVRETITEELYTGHPVKSYSYLEHAWNFTLPSGGTVNFHLEASRTNNSEGDNFAFEYSTDGVNWNPLLTLASATESAYSVPLGSLSGAVTVRATDTNRSWGNTVLDALSIDYMAFEVGDVQPQPPVANFSGSPTSGAYPLTVTFTDQSTGNPTAWSWNFGDNGTSTVQNPVHTYTAAGTYTVTLTATNEYGSDAEVKTDYITVTEGGTTVLHVSDISVSRKTAGPNNNGQAYVTIVDQGGSPIAGATVSGFFNAPNTNTKSAVTGTDGVAIIQSDKTKSPPADFCFEVTNVELAGATYDAGSNAVTTACESGWVSGAMAASQRNNAVPEVFGLYQNYPNPFRAETEITFGLPSAAHVRLEVFNVRGERIAVLADRSFGPGVHMERWDAGRLASGIYFYRLSTGDFVQTKKMILLR